MQDLKAESIQLIVDQHLELMRGEVGMCHSRLKFWFNSNDSEGDEFRWFDDDGVTPMVHPSFQDITFGERIELQYPYSERIFSILNEARQQDKAAGVPIRNVYDIKVYRNGRHEFQFYHDADLVAVQKARSAKAEKNRAKRQQDLQAVNSTEDNSIPDQSSQSVSRVNLEKYEILKEKIYRKADNIWHAEVFLRYQAALVAPDNWEEVRIEMIKQDENSTRMTVSYTHLTLPTIYSV